MEDKTKGTMITTIFMLFLIIMFLFMVLMMLNHNFGMLKNIIEDKCIITPNIVNPSIMINLTG